MMSDNRELGSTEENTNATHMLTGPPHQFSSNFSASFNKSELHRQIDVLNKQVHEQSKRNHSMQQVENGLLDKLDRKELENMELKDALEGLKQQLDIKGDVISKAQVIIQKLTTKSEQDEALMTKLNTEANDLKQEVSHKQRAVNDLHS